MPCAVFLWVCILSPMYTNAALQIRCVAINYNLLPIPVILYCRLNILHIAMYAFSDMTNQVLCLEVLPSDIQITSLFVFTRKSQWLSRDLQHHTFNKCGLYFGNFEIFYIMIWIAWLILKIIKWVLALYCLCVMYWKLHTRKLRWGFCDIVSGMQHKPKFLIEVSCFDPNLGWFPHHQFKCFLIHHFVSLPMHDTSDVYSSIFAEVSFNYLVGL